MRKSIISLVLLMAISIVSMAQNVGIGTTNPSAQLHTTGTVRHAVLSGSGIRPLFVDANGNLLATIPALPASSATNNNAQAIPDISCTGVSSINSLSGLPTMVQSSTIMVKVNITHTKLSDLSIYLLAPGGAVITLVNPSAALTGANFTNTVFRDDGNLLSTGTAPFTGNFKPRGDMTPSICGLTPTIATFGAIGSGNINPNGNWTLRVIDNTASNTGTLNNWTVSVVSGLGVDGVWGLKGNSGTNAFNFIGTTDKNPLRFKVNNITSGLIDTTTQNTFFGYGSVNINLKGPDNTGFGTGALASNTTGQSNTATGSGALAINATGNYNTAIGSVSLLYNNSGNWNTAVGSYSLFENTTGSWNTAIGANALYNSQTSNTVAVGESALYNNNGELNTAVGTRSLYANTSGSNNTALGFQALVVNTTGNWNTAIGTRVLAATTTGFNNTSVGSYSLLNNTTGNQNAALGSDALHENKEGSLNTAIGLASMYNNISGYGNTAVGFNSLVLNTIGSANTANGHLASFHNTTGNSNTAIGVGALYKNTSVSNLVAVGDSALFNNGSNPVNSTDGSKNTGIGSRALFNNNTGQSSTAAGYHALFNNTSGSSNTAVGMNALNNITSGSSNTAIGSGADVFNGGFSNATAIGAGAIAPSSNSIKLGNNSITNIYSNNNSNMWVGNLYEKGNGIVRNTSSLQLKMSRGSYVVSGTINALSTIQIPFSYNEIFSTVPVVYVGNITGGPGGFAEIIMSIANATTTGATLFVSNPRTMQVAPNFTVNIVAIGGE